MKNWRDHRQCNAPLVFLKTVAAEMGDRWLSPRDPGSPSENGNGTR